MRLRLREGKIKEAVEFHGHLGPYLILGLHAGELALEELGAKKHFGIDISVAGARKRPKSCFIDGLQLSTGATYGKGNIRSLPGRKLRLQARNKDTAASLEISLAGPLEKKLLALKGHHDSEAFARELYKADPNMLFIVSPKSQSQS